MTTAPSPIPGYLTTGEAAALCGRTPEHLSLLCRKKKIKAVRIGRDWLIEQASLEAYIATDPRPGAKSKHAGK